MSALKQSFWAHPDWYMATAVVVLGLFVYGLSDLSRFSLRRARAIASVCFAESWRRKVLLLPILGILGVMLVSHFQRPLDEQDAVRQMIKFWLFTTGMLVVVVGIILACTNLPKEIDNRVIYTVVTKPMTRLEIIFGKLMGFAAVSAGILLVMGIATYGYLEFQTYNLQRAISERLASPNLDPSMRGTLEYYQATGLLTSRTLSQTRNVQVYARSPDRSATGSGDTKWIGMAGAAADGEMLFAFDVPPDALIPPGDASGSRQPGIVRIRLKVGYEQVGPTRLSPLAEDEYDPTVPLPQYISAPGTVVATGAASGVVPAVHLQILNSTLNSLVTIQQLNGGRAVTLADPSGTREVFVDVPGDRLVQNNGAVRIYLSITGATAGFQYAGRPDSAQLAVLPVAPGVPPRFIDPIKQLGPDEWVSESPYVRGRDGRSGQQVRGVPPATDPKIMPVAVYRFANAKIQSDMAIVPFEFRSNIETSDADGQIEEHTRVTLSVYNRESKATSPPVDMYMESNRPAFFKVPAEFVRGGNFDVVASVLATGHYVTVTSGTLAVVGGTEGFFTNLLKSLLIMWLMSILVIAIALMCSTFLSWPIAIVLTLIILLGHWGVEQLGDATLPGIGASIATDLGFQSAEKSAVVSQTVEKMARGLNLLAGVLPDISKFSATEDIERGISITPARLIEPLKVLAIFALPTMVLAYVVFRQKEVAP